MGCHSKLCCFAVAILSLLLDGRCQVHAQTSRANVRKQTQAMQQMQEAMKRRLQQIADQDKGMPEDPQLQSLHREFITKTEKLAMEYERKKQFDKARQAYQSIVRLVPDYAGGNQGLARVLAGQTSQDRKVVPVQADEDWQDTGVTLVEGMPVKIDIQGTWKVTVESGPAGIEIPKDQRPPDNRIRFGSLIGAIVQNPMQLKDAKPILFAESKEFVASSSGRLFLRMFDTDPSDNDGKLLVLIQSTFGN